MNAPRQIRQLAYISEFTTDIRHISGSENLPADALSRLVVDAVGNVVDLDYDKLAIAQASRFTSINISCSTCMASPKLTSQSYSALYTTYNTAFEHRAAFGSRKVQT